MDNIFFYNTIIGEIAIADDGTSITTISFTEKNNFNNHIENETSLIKTAAKQLDEYFKGHRKTFNLPLSPRGTDFQKQVWNSLLEIPYGETKTYKDIAFKINNPKSCRAVGMANNKNPIMIVIPCHRVIGANGKLVGYGGGLKVKEFLLNLEKSNKKIGS